MQINPQHRRKVERFLSALLLTAFLWISPAWSGEIQDDFSKSALPILRQSCFACHGPKPNNPDSIQDEDLRKKALKTVIMAQREFPMAETFPFPDSDDTPEDLKLLAKTLKKGLMPPKDQKQFNYGAPLAEKDKKILLDWVARCLKALH
jgi:hypothetical protein